ncbi:MAG: phosphoribosyl-ATP diphosphatase [Nitrosomonadales bacterium]|jgi:phosphoribosyl-ATP pyrophosphohydrolase|nr:phosphoribosyl-ATP diphosphatase [Nitrosomonadales bacterium]MBT3918348.1 phosphoribosyl-ATP diphosphatase [Nitrosomonadales bacterium]MBT4570790.1 phosphoribosyl-ATP diphosphatase [Nitrosomonadales bacterium]MBT4758931.1 phosphoribosyl-ATP diphosphatase [Nitrosomonadales bacterium]MBT5149723.1 phosphoribosyl-ATP diphosphatase [Nitrosomonadales bacterium]
MKDEFLEHLLTIIKSKKNENPKASYTAMLQQKDLIEILKKIEEEAFEVIDAAKFENKSDIIHEVADLWFHCLVLLAKKNLSVEDITNELKKRQGISGIEEKLNRVKK